MNISNKNLYAVISAGAVIIFMIAFPFVFNVLTKKATEISSLSISKYELPSAKDSIFSKFSLLPRPEDKSQNIITKYEDNSTTDTATDEDVYTDNADTVDANGAESDLPAAATDDGADSNTLDQQNLSTYTNSKYGFSLSVPSSYIVMEQYIYEEVPGIRLKFAKSQGEHSYNEVSIKLEYYRYDTTTSIDVLKTLKEQDDTQVANAVPLIIDQIESIKYHFSTTPPKHMVYSAKETDGLVLELNPEDNNSIEILEYIVKTFKFPGDLPAASADTADSEQ